MAISNCASCGADSFADPLTGVVSRRNEQTGQIEPASVRAAGQDNTQSASSASNSVQAAATLSDTPTLSAATQTAAVQVSEQFQQALASRESVQAYSQSEGGEASPELPEVEPSAGVDISL